MVTSGIHLKCSLKTMSLTLHAFTLFRLWKVLESSLQLLKLKPDAVTFKVLLGDIKEPSHVKRESTLCPSASKDLSRTELLKENMHKKNTAREPAEPTLQRAHNARRVKTQHDLSTTK